MKFRTALLATGGNTTGIEVPQTFVEALGQGKRAPVKVSFSGYSYQGGIGIMGGRSLIPVSVAHREASGVKVGDKIEIAVELDTSR